MTRCSAALFAVAIPVSICGCLPDLPVLTECVAADGVTPICRFSNPEDLALLPDGHWMIVSQFAMTGSGSLVAYHVERGELKSLRTDEPPAVSEPADEDDLPWGDEGCRGPLAAGEIAPHGIDIVRADDGTLRLLVVNHGTRESVEIYEVNPAGPHLTWRGCVAAPEEVWLNDVAALRDGGLVATNMATPAAMAGVRILVPLFFGTASGNLLEWSAGGGWRAIEDSESSLPNGIEVSDDERFVFVALSGGDEIVRIGRDGSGRRAAALGHAPDNLTWTADGRLLSAGRTGPDTTVIACVRIEEGGCGAPFSVVVVDPETLEGETVLEHGGAVIGAASVALEVRDVVFIGSYKGDRIAHVDNPL